MTATRQDVERMDELQARVLAQIEEGERWMSTITTVDGVFAVLPSWMGAAKDAIISDTQRSQITAVKMARETFSSWSTSKRAWAMRGTRDDGKAYAVTDWLSLGDAIGSQLTSALGAFWEAMPIYAPVGTAVEAKDSAVELAADVKEGLEAARDRLAAPWSWKVKAGLTALGVTVGLGAIGMGLNALPGWGLVKKVTG